MYKPSKIITFITGLLHKREQKGIQTYGTDLDRRDFDVGQWLHHQIEELLDGAGYSAAALREWQKTAEELAILRAKEWYFFDELHKFRSDSSRKQMTSEDVYRFCFNLMNVDNHWVMVEHARHLEKVVAESEKS